MFPPHAIALGSIYVAALLTFFEQPNQPVKISSNDHPGCRSSEKIATMLGQEGPWESRYKVRAEDLDG
jgi:CTD kinase subunit beta